MWSARDVTIEIDEVEGQTMIVIVGTPAGAIEILGSIRSLGRVLHVERAHVQGLRPGALGRAGLNAIGRKMLEEADVDQVIIEGSARTTGKGRGRVPRPIRFPR